MVVEDDPVTRELLRDILMDWGYEVVVAKDGQAAWDVIRRKKIRFVIADWLMPLMDGVSLCRRIRSLKGAGYVYFILLTGKDAKDDIIEGLNAGADDYVTKPFNRNELKVRVQAGRRILELEKELTEKNRKLLALNVELEELARIDPLMCIGNRRSFHETIEKVHHRACRYERSYGIIMCDIDNFKAFNDTYGHLAGDNLLRGVADSVRELLRVSDDVFRYGGEEIVILLPEQNIKTTAVVAERIRKDVETMSIENAGSDRGIITISCGVSAFDKDCIDGRWEAVLKKADDALYAAKSAGRNRVVSSSGH